MGPIFDLLVRSLRTPDSPLDVSGRASECVEHRLGDRRIWDYDLGYHGRHCCADLLGYVCHPLAGNGDLRARCGRCRGDGVRLYYPATSGLVCLKPTAYGPRRATVSGFAERGPVTRLDTSRLDDMLRLFSEPRLAIFVAPID